MNKLLLTLASGLLLVSSATAGEKKVMHCFAFTAVDSASKADWDAFFKATDVLPTKIKGLTHVWYGKLARPINVDGQSRQWGVCMEMDSPEVRRAYGNDPAHKVWEEAYSKVRVEGTTTYDILGQ